MRLRAPALLLALAACFPAAAQDAASTGDTVTVLTAARIHTQDARQPQATAIAWDGQGRIIAVGAAAELRKRYPAARRIDAGKATVVPAALLAPLVTALPDPSKQAEPQGRRGR